MGPIHAAVVDARVFADYYFLFPKNPERHKRARTILDKLSDLRRLGVVFLEEMKNHAKGGRS